MEARGNAQSYAAQGINFVRSSLNYGHLSTVQTHIVGWFEQKRFTYADDFHTFSLEWTPDWMRFYVDSRLQATLTIDITGRGGHSFFDRGHYPATAHNGSDTEAVVTNIWEEAGGSAAAPFDQSFYLILDLAVGGTSGWFPDGVGGKPWLDGSNGEYPVSVNRVCRTDAEDSRSGDARLCKGAGPVVRDVAVGYQRPRDGRRLGQDVAEVLNGGRRL